MVSQELLAACRRGDDGAFEEVVQRTYKQVYTLAFRLVGDRHEAEDVLQEAYLRVLRGIGGFREDSRFETWLYRIVSNVAMSHLRRKARLGDLALDPHDVGREIPSRVRIAEEAVDRDALSAALASLPASMRAVVVLRDVYGLSAQEAGEALGISEGAVKVRLHRARKKLKQALFGPEVLDEV